MQSIMSWKKRSPCLHYQFIIRLLFPYESGFWYSCIYPLFPSVHGVCALLCRPLFSWCSCQKLFCNNTFVRNEGYLDILYDSLHNHVASRLQWVELFNVSCMTPAAIKIVQQHTLSRQENNNLKLICSCEWLIFLFWSKPSTSLSQNDY